MRQPRETRTKHNTNTGRQRANGGRRPRPTNPTRTRPLVSNPLEPRSPLFRSQLSLISLSTLSRLTRPGSPSLGPRAHAEQPRSDGQKYPRRNAGLRNAGLPQYPRGEPRPGSWWPGGLSPATALAALTAPLVSFPPGQPASFFAQPADRIYRFVQRATSFTTSSLFTSSQHRSPGALLSPGAVLFPSLEIF